MNSGWENSINLAWIKKSLKSDVTVIFKYLQDECVNEDLISLITSEISAFASE